MDVTSLLNSSTPSAEQKERTETSRTPTRNRTPWDAGGYSLPINTISNSHSTTLQQIHHYDSHYEIPTSPKHKFSDSRSSQSSYTSSLQSATHSRFSSMSTVNSSHPLNSLTAECLSPDIRRAQQRLELMSFAVSPSAPGQSSGETQERTSISTTGPLEALPLVAEHRAGAQDPDSEAHQVSGTMTMTNSTNDILGNSLADMDISPGRPTSPSDAILIKRATGPTLRVNTEDLGRQPLDRQQMNSNHLTAPFEFQSEGLMPSKRHKRAVSAPDFLAIKHNFVPRKATSLGPRAELTPPSSYHPDHSSPQSPMRSPAPDTPPTTVAESEVLGSQDVVCMYIANCDTGSQPRKAISHIFGRNKMCTRLIPQHVWVHYCRKHYQRSRYRNPKEYAKLQCDLVQQQIRRVHDWSQSNMVNGKAGVVQDWGLAIRKREQKRLDDLGGANRKRRAANSDRNESDEGENAEDGNGRGNHVPATAVPEWLLALCGKGYSTSAILEIFNRLHTEILDDLMSCFPDIEILPNITVDQEEPKSPKGYTKRTPFVSGHKRSQSLGGVAMNPDHYSSYRKLSQPGLWDIDEPTYGSPLQKRRRPNDWKEEDSVELALPPFQRHRPLETGRRIQQLAHRPVFANIDEHQADGNEYEEAQMRENYPTQSPADYRAPLPAPTAQRWTTQSMAGNLEIKNAHVQMAVRPKHQRSLSDRSTLQRGGMDYSPAPSSGHAMDTSHHSWHSKYLEQGQPIGSINPPPHYGEKSSVRSPPHFDVRLMRQAPAQGHIRHQSTPMITTPYSHLLSPTQRDFQLLHPRYQYPHTYPNPLLPTPNFIESHQMRDPYISRH